MAKKKERKKTYKFIEKLIDKVTTSKSNNTEFVCYGHLVELLSGTEDYVSVTIYNTDDRYGGGMADFDFDYLTKELHFVSSEGKALTEKIIATFRMFYSPRRIRVSYDELEYEEIARILDSKVETLKVNYHYAKEKIKEYILNR